jgi:hypothetical protein
MRNTSVAAGRAEARQVLAPLAVPLLPHTLLVEGFPSQRTCASLKIFFLRSMIFKRPPSIHMPTSPAAGA